VMLGYGKVDDGTMVFSNPAATNTKDHKQDGAKEAA